VNSHGFYFSKKKIPTGFGDTVAREKKANMLSYAAFASKDIPCGSTHPTALMLLVILVGNMHVLRKEQNKFYDEI
jgi:hypothetical protein